MSNEGVDRAPQPSLSRFVAWRNALAITLLGCLLPGLGCFVLLGDYLPRHFDLFHAAVLQQLAFSGAMVIIFGVILGWQRARGLTLADLGWCKPVTGFRGLVAMVVAVLLGILFILGNYFNVRHLLSNEPHGDLAEFNWIRIALMPLGLLMAIVEEMMMRGFFMTELQRARVASWLQIVASGACSAIYHALNKTTLSGFSMAFFPAFVLFSVHAGLYVLARRSLTPPIVAHSIYNVFGEPYLLMVVFATQMRS